MVHAPRFRGPRDGRLRTDTVHAVPLLDSGDAAGRYGGTNTVDGLEEVAGDDWAHCILTDGADLVGGEFADRLQRSVLG